MHVLDVDRRIVDVGVVVCCLLCVDGYPVLCDIHVGVVELEVATVVAKVVDDVVTCDVVDVVMDVVVVGGAIQ